MMRLAVASLRSRMTAFVAYFLSVCLGAIVIGAFATLLEAAAGPVSSKDRETLITLGTVVGSWGLVIVLFSVASTLTLTVGQRRTELALLRAVGATARQNRRLLLAESSLVTIIATLVAAPFAWLAGAGVFALLRHADMLAASTERGTGVVALGATTVAMVIVSVSAVLLATRRSARISVQEAARDSAAGPARTSRWRIAIGLIFLAAGLNYAILTVTVMADSDDPYAAMSTAGPACVVASMGLAILAPVLLRVAALVGGGALRRFGAAGHLAAHDLQARSHTLAAVLAPVIVFVGMGTGTIYLVAIENQASGPATDEGRNIELLNYVVVGMVTVFAAIMVVNTLAAAISARRREFGQQRLAGATPGQVRTTMLLQGAVVVATGLVAGGIASLTTVLSYSQVKLDRLVPDLGWGYFAGIAMVAVTVTLTSTYVSTRRALRPAAVEAVALSAA